MTPQHEPKSEEPCERPSESDRRAPRSLHGGRLEDLARLGTSGQAADLEAAVELALTEASPGLRIAAATAAADLLARHRVGPSRELVPLEMRSRLLLRLRGTDPGRNPGLLQVMACLDLPEVPPFLARALRDPRADVRRGALAGLERLMLSGAALDDPSLGSFFLRVLDEPARQPEILFDLLRLAERLGILEARDRMRLHAEASLARWHLAIDALRLSLEERYAPQAQLGLWVSDGADAGSPVPGLEPLQFLFVAGEVTLLGGDADLRWSASEWREGWVAFEAPPPPYRAPMPFRRIDARCASEAPISLLQLGGRTFRGADERSRLLFLCLLADRVDATPTQQARVMELLEPRCSKRPAGVLSRVLLDLWRGEREAASLALDSLVASGKAPVEAYYFQGRLLLGRGDPSGREVLAAFLKKAGKKSIFGQSARALLDSPA